MGALYLDHVGRGKCKPLVERNVLVFVGVEDFEELERSVADIFNVVAEGGRNVSYISVGKDMILMYSNGETHRCHQPDNQRYERWRKRRRLSVEVRTGVTER